MNATTERGSDDERPGKKSEAATATANDKRATGRARRARQRARDKDRCGQMRAWRRREGRGTSRGERLTIHSSVPSSPHFVCQWRTLREQGRYVLGLFYQLTQRCLSQSLPQRCFRASSPLVKQDGDGLTMHHDGQLGGGGEGSGGL